MKFNYRSLNVMVSIFLAILFILCLMWFSHENKEWNGGHCTECGGKYRFSSVSHWTNSSDRYFYTCEDCGHTISTFRIMK